MGEDGAKTLDSEMDFYFKFPSGECVQSFTNEQVLKRSKTCFYFRHITQNGMVHVIRNRINMCNILYTVQYEFVLQEQTS